MGAKLKSDSNHSNSTNGVDFEEWLCLNGREGHLNNFVATELDPLEKGGSLLSGERNSGLGLQIKKRRFYKIADNKQFEEQYLGEKGDDGLASVAANDGDLDVGGGDTRGTTNKGLCTNNVERGDTKQPTRKKLKENNGLLKKCLSRTSWGRSSPCSSTPRQRRGPWS